MTSVDQTLEKRRREVTLTEARDDHDDGLAGRLRGGGDLRSSSGRRPRGDADEQTLLGGRLAGPLQCLLEVDVDDLVVDLRVQDLRHEVRTEALDLVWSGLSAVEDRRLGRLHRDDLDLGLALLQHLTDTGDRSARADALHEDVDLAVVGPPYLFG